MSPTDRSGVSATTVLGWIALLGGIAILIYEFLGGGGISLVGIIVAGLGAIALSAERDDPEE